MAGVHCQFSHQMIIIQKRINWSDIVRGVLSDFVFVLWTTKPIQQCFYAVVNIRVCNTNKAFSAPSLAISLAAFITVCGGVVKTLPRSINDSFSEIVNKNSKELLIDDIYELDEEVGVVNVATGKVEKVQFEDAVKMLEDSYEVDKKINDLDIKETELNELDDLHKSAAMKIFKENGLDTIIELYNDKDNNKIEKARIAQQLLYIQKMNDEWLAANGITLSQSLLKRVISAGAIEAYGTFTANEYDVCDLSDTDNGFVKEIKLVDNVSGAKDKIVLLPIIADEYYTALGEYDKLLKNEEAKKEYTIEETKDIVKETLNNVKRCCNKKLVNNGSFTYIKKI